MPSLVETVQLLLNVVYAFLLFCYYLPIVNGVALHLQQIESPLPKVPSLVKTGPVVLQKIFKCCQCIFTISLLSPHGEGHGLSFEQT